MQEKTSKVIGEKSWMKCTDGYFGENMTMERWQKGYSEKKDTNTGILPKRSDADGKNLCERQTGDKRRTFEL